MSYRVGHYSRAAHVEREGAGAHRQAVRPMRGFRGWRLLERFAVNRRGHGVTHVPGVFGRRRHGPESVRQSARQRASTARLQNHEVREREEAEGSDQAAHESK